LLFERTPQPTKQNIFFCFEEKKMVDKTGDVVRMDIDEGGRSILAPGSRLLFPNNAFGVDSKQLKMPASKSDQESTTWETIRQWMASQLNDVDQKPASLVRPAAGSWYDTNNANARTQVIQQLSEAYRRQLEVLQREYVGPDHSKVYPLFVQWWFTFRTRHIAAFEEKLRMLRDGWPLFVSKRDELLKMVNDNKVEEVTITLPTRDCWVAGWENPPAGIESLVPQQKKLQSSSQPFLVMRGVPNNIDETALRTGEQSGIGRWLTGASRWLVDWLEGIHTDGIANPGWQGALLRSGRAQWRLQLTFVKE
jgi:hypothetical protein